MKKITFTPVDQFAENVYDPPLPASKVFPEWHKKTNKYIDPSLDLPVINDGTNSKNFTIKQCVPVLDTMLTGYIFTLQSDIVCVDPEKYNGDRIIWGQTDEIISKHLFDQVKTLDIPDEYEKAAYKWSNFWKIKTPKNYSILITQPFYRFDLPFYTLGGIVDTDLWNNDSPAINFPFFLKKDFYGFIKKGTPIAQVIPIKRDAWTHKINKYNPQTASKEYRHLNYLQSYYRKFFWNKKSYK